MFNDTTIIFVICLYIAFLFFVAMWVERKAAKGKNPGDNAIVYSLSLAIYCTSWTYYGSVGNAASSGMLFLTIYIGPTLAIILWWKVLRKLIRIKQSFRINSIADFIAARYNNSQLLAAIATLIALLGIAPYIALQFKAVISTFTIMTSRDTPDSSWVSSNMGPIVVVLMIGFTIIFGVRRLDPTERHSGMVMAVAVESLVKLVSFLAAGIFVCYLLFNGPGDIIQQWSESRLSSNLSNTGSNHVSFATWMTYLILAMSAIMFLPRQFHISVVENSNENHIRTAMWLFPLYLFIINIFVLPIAMGGLLKGLPLENADTFVLDLPLQYGRPWLALLVFIGGFSAAISMIMISSMTMATMITNHLLLPVVDITPGLGFLRRHVLKMRWAAISVVIILGYWVERRLGGSYTLVNMGMISFAAALQFAPSVLGGIFWRMGNRFGAIMGLSTGFIIWFYTLFLPSLIKSGWLAFDLLKDGPWGMHFLRPEQLFGLTGLDPLTHAVFWTMFFNIGCYILGSLLFEENENGEKLAETFVGILSPVAELTATIRGKLYIDLPDKKQKVKKLLCRYLDQSYAETMIQKCLDSLGIGSNDRISVLQLADFHSKAEKILAGAVGTIAAHKTFKDAMIFDPEESKELSAAYGEILADLKVTPDELKQKIDFYQERESIITAHASALEDKVAELKDHIVERKKAEEALRSSEEHYRVLLDASPDAIVAYDENGNTVYINPAFEKTYGWSSEELLSRKIDFVPDHEKEKTEQAIKRNRTGENIAFETQRLCKDGRLLDILLKTAVIKDNESSPCGFIVIHRDITESKRAEEELRQAQKMEIVGTLAGGLAHDFNNILAGIMGTLSLMKHKLLKKGSIEKQKLEHYLEIMVESSKRAADMTKQLLTLSRKQELALAPVNLNLTIKRVLKIAENTFDKSIKLISQYVEIPAMIHADPTQIEQVLLNFCVNAGHAMTIMKDKDEQWGGTLTLSLEQISADKYLQKTHPQAEVKEYWILSVKDNGVGMDAETLTKIFNPFFTTKKKGKGTGLGLSMVYNIIKQHQGFVKVYSEVGIGSTFNIYLPVMGKIKTEASSDIKENGISYGEGLILVVEDEEFVRLTASEILDECGYDVMLAENGKKGVDLFKKNHKQITAVLLDMSMPEMSGKQAYIKMKEIDPTVKVLLVSGFKQDDRVAEVMRMGVNDFLQKPYTLKKLALALHNVILNKKTAKE